MKSDAQCHMAGQGLESTYLTSSSMSKGKGGEGIQIHLDLLCAQYCALIISAISCTFTL